MLTRTFWSATFLFELSVTSDVYLSQRKIREDNNRRVGHIFRERNAENVLRYNVFAVASVYCF